MKELKVVFRLNKEYNITEMFYRDGKYNKLIAFSLEESHCFASYSYYLECKPIKEITPEIQKIINYYENEPEPIKLKICQRLNKG